MIDTRNVWYSSWNAISFQNLFSHFGIFTKNGGGVSEHLHYCLCSLHYRCNRLATLGQKFQDGFLRVFSLFWGRVSVFLSIVESRGIEAMSDISAQQESENLFIWDIFLASLFLCRSSMANPFSFFYLLHFEQGLTRYFHCLFYLNEACSNPEYDSKKMLLKLAYLSYETEKKEKRSHKVEGWFFFKKKCLNQNKFIFLTCRVCTTNPVDQDHI